MSSVITLGCRPVELTEVEEAGFRQAGVTIGAYPDSIKGTCNTCSREVWIGPRQQKLAEVNGVVTICLLCAVLQDPNRPVHHLGNPTEPGDIQ